MGVEIHKVAKLAPHPLAVEGKSAEAVFIGTSLGLALEILNLFLICV